MKKNVLFIASVLTLIMLNFTACNPEVIPEDTPTENDTNLTRYDSVKNCYLEYNKYGPNYQASFCLDELIYGFSDVIKGDKFTISIDFLTVDGLKDLGCGIVSTDEIDNWWTNLVQATADDPFYSVCKSVEANKEVKFTVDANIIKTAKSTDLSQYKLILTSSLLNGETEDSHKSYLKIKPVIKVTQDTSKRVSPVTIDFYKDTTKVSSKAYYSGRIFYDYLPADKENKKFFLGWSYKNSEEYINIVPEENCSLYAVYDENAYYTREGVILLSDIEDFGDMYFIVNVKECNSINMTVGNKNPYYKLNDKSINFVKGEDYQIVCDSASIKEYLNNNNSIELLINGDFDSYEILLSYNSKWESAVWHD